jgi:general secretion pathway protein A
MYLDYYGFSDKPFELSPNQKFFYLTTGHQSALEAVLGGIKGRRGWIVLTGEVGTGKTTLIYGLLGRQLEKIKTAFIFHPTFRFGELLEQILHELGEPVLKGGADQLKIQFIAFLKKVKQQGVVLAVLIDEAQKLSKEVARELFSLLAGEPWISETLQLVLVGQPELDEIIDTVVLKYHLPKPGLRLMIYPLSRQESQDYIEHRLRVVGSSSERIFSPQALSFINEYAKGIPRVINILCDNALRSGYNAGLKKIGIDIIWKVIGNLEGPNYKQKIQSKPPRGVSSSRFLALLFSRPWLIVIVAILLAAGISLVRFGGGTRLFPPKVSENSKGEQVPLLNKPPKEEQAQPKDAHSASSDGQQTALEESAARNIRIPSLTGNRRIQVKKGDSLSKISTQYYGMFNESLVDLMLSSNSSIRDANLILENQVIQLPIITEETLILPTPDNTFTILLGTFSTPAQVAKYKGEPALSGKNITIHLRRVSRHDTWSRVEAGRYRSRAESLAVINTLRAKKLLPFFK